MAKSIKAAEDTTVHIPEPYIAHMLFADTRMAGFWLILRVYAGYQWVVAGYEKVISPVWVGPHAGVALRGFLMGALKKSAGVHPDVSGWYKWLIENVALHNLSFISHLVAYGELLVGVALILGLFTGIAAFLGAFMNMNYLFAGTVSTNPLLFLIELFLILAWRTAGWLGLDKFLLPLLGTPWKHGKLFK